MTLLLDTLKLLLGGKSCQIRLRIIRVDHVLEGRHADHEELVQIGRGDGQELQSLEQRIRLVSRFIEDPVVEVQPAKFTVRIILRIFEIDLGSSILRCARCLLGSLHRCLLRGLCHNLCFRL